MNVATKPETADDWRRHAEDLHRSGLVEMDMLTNAGDLPVDVAAVRVEHARMTFEAARSAIAIADHLRGPDRAR